MEEKEKKQTPCVNLHRWLRRFPLYMVIMYRSSFALGQRSAFGYRPESEREREGGRAAGTWFFLRYFVTGYKLALQTEALLKRGSYHAQRRERGGGVQCISSTHTHTQTAEHNHTHTQWRGNYDSWRLGSQKKFLQQGKEIYIM